MKPSIKSKRRLAKRIADYEESAKHLTPAQLRGFRKPGSRSPRKS